MKTIPIREIKAPQNESKASESFSIRNVQNMLSGEDMVQGLHRHDFFYILTLKKGKGSHSIDFNNYNVVDHSIFFMRPGQVHELALNRESTGYLMEFRRDFYNLNDTVASQFLRKASSINLCNPDTKSFKKLFALLALIFSEYGDKKEGYQEVIKANLNIFFIELVRNRQPRNAVTASVNKYTQEKLDKFTELLDAHISSHKEVSQYADMLNLSTFQLNAITKTTLGKTSSQLINDYIILEAKRYLLATSNQVNQIAYHLGYEDVSYFIRFFKKQTSYTPEAFRHNSG